MKVASTCEFATHMLNGTPKIHMCIQPDSLIIMP